MTEYVELCGNCGEPVDPQSHTMNPTTGTRYCSGDCWAMDVL